MLPVPRRELLRRPAGFSAGARPPSLGVSLRPGPRPRGAAKATCRRQTRVWVRGPAFAVCGTVQGCFLLRLSHPSHVHPALRIMTSSPKNGLRGFSQQRLWGLLAGANRPGEAGSRGSADMRPQTLPSGGRFDSASGVTAGTALARGGPAQAQAGDRHRPSSLSTATLPRRCRGAQSLTSGLVLPGAQLLSHSCVLGEGAGTRAAWRRAPRVLWSVRDGHLGAARV